MKRTYKDRRSARVQCRSRTKQWRRTLWEMSPSQCLHQCLSGWSSLERRSGAPATERVSLTVLGCRPRLEYRWEPWSSRRVGDVEPGTGRSHGLFWSRSSHFKASYAIHKVHLSPQADSSTTSIPGDMGAEIFSPVTLPCSGRTMSNRLAKVCAIPCCPGIACLTSTTSRSPCTNTLRICLVALPMNITLVSIPNGQSTNGG